MEKNTKQLIQSQFKSLPSDVQESILSLDLGKSLKAITEMQPLEENQLTAIENEVMLIFLGFDDVVSLTTNIKYSAEISRERAEKIARAIQQKIFIPHAAVLEKVLRLNSNSSQEMKKTTEQRVDRLQSIPEVKETHKKDMFHKKLTQQVHIPKEEEKINLEEKEAKEKPKKDAPSIDPYREPID